MAGGKRAMWWGSRDGGREGDGRDEEGKAKGIEGGGGGGHVEWVWVRIIFASERFIYPHCPFT